MRVFFLYAFELKGYNLREYLRGMRNGQEYSLYIQATIYIRNGVVNLAHVRERKAYALKAFLEKQREHLVPCSALAYFRARYYRQALNSEQGPPT